MGVRAGGKIKGVRYASSHTYAPLVPSGSRIAGGKVAGVRYAGQGYGVEEIPVAPLVFASGASVSSITSAGFTVQAVVNKDATASLIVTSTAASQPSDAAFDASIVQQSVLADTRFTIAHTGDAGGALKRAWLQVIVGGERVTSSALALMPQAGYSQVTLTSLAAMPRLQASPVLAVGEVLSWGNIVGGGTVIVNNDGSFDASASVKSFDVFAGNYTTGWRALETQFLVGSVNLLFMAAGV